MQTGGAFGHLIASRSEEGSATSKRNSAAWHDIGSAMFTVRRIREIAEAQLSHPVGHDSYNYRVALEAIVTQLNAYDSSVKLPKMTTTITDSRNQNHSTANVMSTLDISQEGTEK
jgi:hypothetical protein